ncbi:MAG: hypothetical protein DID91_2727702304 [Candidatus Nitrotoga sp. MKT]|nr:MAG: hypothetical protein DID91_2727702304 [Candidatus Nitrotoga sp. MKT]
MILFILVKLFKATLNESVRVELVETHQLKINRLQISSTGSARMEGLVQYYLKLPAASLDHC